jgi:hypothetical protein
MQNRQPMQGGSPSMTIPSADEGRLGGAEPARRAGSRSGCRARQAAMRPFSGSRSWVSAGKSWPSSPSDPMDVVLGLPRRAVVDPMAGGDAVDAAGPGNGQDRSPCPPFPCPRGCAAVGGRRRTGRDRTVRARQRAARQPGPSPVDLMNSLMAVCGRHLRTSRDDVAVPAPGLHGSIVVAASQTTEDCCCGTSGRLRCWEIACVGLSLP